MDDKSGGQKAAEEGRLEVAVVGSGATSGDFSKGEATVSTNTDGQRVEADLGDELDADLKDEGDEEAEGEAADDGDKANSEESADSDEADGEADGEPSEAPVGELGEWNKDDAELAKKFHKHYWNEEGTELNFSKFSEELEANLETGVADINKGARAYLKDQLGVSDKFIDDHIKGQLALREQNDTKFYDIVGGKETYEKKLGWAKDGYTPEQKARFNAAIKKGGEDAQEALELLNTRFSKANPETGGGEKNEQPARKGVPGKERLRASPEKTTSAAAPSAGTGPKPYASLEEHRTAQDAAIKSGDPAKLKEVSERLRASPKLWKQS